MMMMSKFTSDSPILDGWLGVIDLDYYPIPVLKGQLKTWKKLRVPESKLLLTARTEEIQEALNYLKKYCAVDNRTALENVESINICDVNSTLSIDELKVKDIVNYVNISQESCHRFGLSIQNILLLKQWNETNFDKFCSKEHISQTNRMYLWHGTDMKNLSSILKQGFQMPKSGDGFLRLQGQGLYFADRATKSAQYCVGKGRNQNPTIGYDGILLLCDVLLGNIYYATKPDNGRQECPHSYHSVVCQGKLIPDSKENRLVGGATLPLGKSIKSSSRLAYPLMFNEYIVYSSKQVKIRAVVHFKYTSCKHQN